MVDNFDKSIVERKMVIKERAKNITDEPARVQDASAAPSASTFALDFTARLRSRAKQR